MILKRAVLDGAHSTDDGEIGAVSIEGLAERRLASEKRARRGLIDDGDVRRVGVIAVVERAARDQWDSYDLEEVGGDRRHG